MALTSFELLYGEYLRQTDAAGQLWVLTDSLVDSCKQLIDQVSAADAEPNTTVLITNRWDIANYSQKTIIFNDYDLSVAAEKKISHVYFHIPKEKAVLNYLLNQCAAYLPSNSRVFIAGEKNQGIKGLAKAAKPLFDTIATQKHGDLYLCELATKSDASPSQTPLKDQNYQQLRVIGELDGNALYSKPGVYGWNKIDAGSALLVDYLKQSQSAINAHTQSVLDLGCGYGFLTLAAHQLGIKSISATDNNAGALLALQATAHHNQFDVTAWPDDTAASCHQKFDLILCNPPFHQGFEHSKDLSSKFCQAIARLKASDGQALVVVNQFIKLEAFTAGLFKQTTPVAGNGSYTIYCLR
ncbi:methyltransferase [Halioxenophilus aromaticivorans]|uniref:Methyltransferase n=1 Tax=Halioxenophilus aromaticivorans TaxID=1306992 RepID=A0AAV3UA92_9ALTE